MRILASVNWLQHACVALVTALIFLPPAPSEGISTGLDNSWVTTMNYAVQHNWIFGRDIIFTFGPLAFLSTRFGHGIPQSWFWMGDLLLLLTSAVGSLQLLRSFGWRMVAVWLLTLYILRCSVYQFETALFLSFLLLVLLGIRKPSLIISLSIVLTGTTLLFIKVNYGIISLAILFGYLLVKPKPEGTWSAKNIAVYACALVLPIVFARFLNTDLLAYLRSSIDIIAGYNEAMNKFQPEPIVLKTFIFAAGLLLIVGLIVAANIRKFIGSAARLFSLGIIAVALFILFKQSFTRADLHVLAFPASVTTLLFLLYLFSIETFDKKSKALIVLSAITSLALLWPYANPLAPVHAIASRLAKPNLAPITNTLPKRMRDHIGNDTVDIITWESSLVYLERLNYNPRPIFQSYSAYTEYLGSKNLEKYLQNGAPRYIIFKLDMIDSRFPMGDEPQLYLHLLSHYELADSTEEYLLLRKRNIPLQSQLTEIRSGSIHPGETISLPQDKSLYLITANVDLSLVGRVMKTLFQAPMLFITSEDLRGSKKTFRIIRDLWRKPVLVSPAIHSTTDFADLMRYRNAADRTVSSLSIHHQVSKTEKGQKLKAAGAWIDRLNGFGFNTEVRYRLFRLNIN